MEAAASRRGRGSYATVGLFTAPPSPSGGSGPPSPAAEGSPSMQETANFLQGLANSPEDGGVVPTSGVGGSSGGAASASGGGAFVVAEAARAPAKPKLGRPAKAKPASSTTDVDVEKPYRCTYPGCVKTFKLPGALHTHNGWHKRRENIDNGVCKRRTGLPPPHILFTGIFSERVRVFSDDKLGHRNKETHHVSDAQGNLTVLDVYRCDVVNCGKIFQTRGGNQHAAMPIAA